MREQALRIVTPEDFVLLKLLSTRARDVDDAAAVVIALADRIDRSLLDSEVKALSREIPDHDIAGRYRQLLDASGTT